MTNIEAIGHGAHGAIGAAEGALAGIQSSTAARAQIVGVLVQLSETLLTLPAYDGTESLTTIRASLARGQAGLGRACDRVWGFAGNQLHPRLQEAVTQWEQAGMGSEARLELAWDNYIQAGAALAQVVELRQALQAAITEALASAYEGAKQLDAAGELTARGIDAVRGFAAETGVPLSPPEGE